MKPPKPSHPIRLVRTGVAVAVLAAIGAGVAFGTDAGTLCAWCPLGFAQTSLASREFHAAVLAPLVAVIAAAALLGRAFCSWGCPSGLVKKRGASRARSSATKRGGQDSKGGCASQGKSCSASAAHPLPSIALIAAVLLASFIVGFPVFCLFCPIGLVFGLMFAIFRSLTVYQPSWDHRASAVRIMVQPHLPARSGCKPHRPHKPGQAQDESEPWHLPHRLVLPCLLGSLPGVTRTPVDRCRIRRNMHAVPRMCRSMSASIARCRHIAPKSRKGGAHDRIHRITYQQDDREERIKL